MYFWKNEFVSSGNFKAVLAASDKCPEAKWLVDKFYPSQEPSRRDLHDKFTELINNADTIVEDRARAHCYLYHFHEFLNNVAVRKEHLKESVKLGYVPAIGQLAHNMFVNWSMYTSSLEKREVIFEMAQRSVTDPLGAYTLSGLYAGKDAEMEWKYLKKAAKLGVSEAIHMCSVKSRSTFDFFRFKYQFCQVEAAYFVNVDDMALKFIRHSQKFIDQLEKHENMYVAPSP